MLNLKNYWTGFQKVTIAFCVMLALVGTLLAPVFTQPAIAQTGSKAAALTASSEKLQVLSDRFDRLEKFVYAQKWNDIITYIHGPFGEIRRELRLIASQLSKTEKETANSLANNLFKNFVILDNAAKDRDAIAAENAFKNALQDFESIVDLVS
ncbi:photosystem II protein PsbQ [Pseudanabaena minima]|uniref:photosystem II protein PsbQ n=1 Tax=Pseudanabaena minima TaxID=890415 RepID=UPI003DA7BE82